MKKFVKQITIPSPPENRTDDYLIKRGNLVHSRFRDLIHTPLFIEYVEKLRLKWAIPAGLNEDDRNEWYRNNIVRKGTEVEEKFMVSISHLCQRFDWPYPYQEMVRDYVLGAPHKEIAVEVGPFLRYSRDVHGNVVLSLVLTPTTNLDEVKKIWSQVEEAQHQVYPTWGKKAFVRKYFVRNMLALELQKDGYILSDIAEVFNGQTDLVYGYGDIESWLAQARSYFHD